MIAGRTVKLGGVDYVVPPLTLGQLRRLEPDIALLGQGTIATQAPAIIRIVHAALSRNYPELTEDAVSELIDLGSMSETIDAVMGVSGLKKEAATEESQPTGVSSTPTS